MIELRNVSKTYVLNGRRKTVADNISAVFPSGRTVAILGRNGAGKSTLLRMISGAMEPDEGQINATGTISWPVGFAGSFHPELTALQNIRFIARVYGVDTDELTEFVKEFAELGQHFYLPIRTYSSGMRSRLAFGVSMGIHFDTYLVDEVTAVGDAAFVAKSDALFSERMKTSGAIMVTHAMGKVKQMADMACILDGGKLTLYDDVDHAIKLHQRMMRGAV
ncbi:ABC transporter related protein [Roseivivax marinus]|jgi:capsular polysaccharide transport system ATP-binding protein|uniref:ABC transporter related protein n=1 Tax=Roseivivax marinus TaxID=1379903 RepID=W4HL67_9RHOB|nr:ABC transporter ATP-binding protein [Roseivivax marinus]ETW12730.1 ABC transporter related protein [Roseivivax marinus]UMA64718.1 ABC transporter ATP-binding protein [Roseivivax marinus]SEL72215.1 capsular polysaccharide transport system ATP-binding protein [Roseivivax marinus]